MASVVEGSSPFTHPKILRRVCSAHEGPLAQLVEQLTLNQRVSGSSPERPTTETQENQAFL